MTDAAQRAISVIALNALNVADAALTVALLRLGLIYEGNPLVLLFGWEAKIIGVALLSLLVWRLKPQWLVAPIIAYSAVIFYTAGMMAYSH